MEWVKTHESDADNDESYELIDAGFSFAETHGDPNGGSWLVTIDGGPVFWQLTREDAMREGRAEVERQQAAIVHQKHPRGPRRSDAYGHK